MIASGNLVGFYDAMEGLGFNYATLAEGVVVGNSVLGLAALNFMVSSAA